MALYQDREDPNSYVGVAACGCVCAVRKKGIGDPKVAFENWREQGWRISEMKTADASKKLLEKCTHGVD